LSREKTVKVKGFLHDLEASVAAASREATASKETLDAVEPLSLTTQPPNMPPQPVAPGQVVVVGGGRAGLQGRVVRADKKGRWVVEIGSLKMSVYEKDLYPLKMPTEPPKPDIAAPDLAQEGTVRLELNLRGMRLEAALEILRRQIDGAVLADLREFAVIHGTGEGVLQRGVHDFLKKQSQVAAYYFSRPELGGFGRTEVIMKC
jgi:DNA mismatch repair protein MutS2